VLSRGYAMALREEQPLTTVEQVAVGETVTIRLSDGQLDCTVTDVKAEKKEEA